MSKTIICLSATSLLLCAAALGQSALLSSEEALTALDASPRWEEWARVRNGEDFVNAWIVFPEREDNAPVVLVIHDAAGLTDSVRATADRLAASGFIAMTPDLLSGKSAGGYGSAAIDPNDIEGKTKALAADEVRSRLAAVIAHANGLKKRASVRAGIKASAPVVPGASGAVGIVGFGWGADAALEFAGSQPEVKALVAYDADSNADSGVPLLRWGGAGDWNHTIDFLRSRLEP